MTCHQLTGRRILLGITGSIAAVGMPQLTAALRLGVGAEVRVVMTRAAARFVTPTALGAAAGGPVHRDDATEGLTVAHVELAAWADLILIMPATANVLAEVALGLAPDLLTTTVLAATCPVVLAPSMNAAMWSARPVQRHAATLREDGIHLVEPVTGVSLGDGSLGGGAMASLDDVLAAATLALLSVPDTVAPAEAGAGGSRVPR